MGYCGIGQKKGGLGLGLSSLLHIIRLALAHTMQARGLRVDGNTLGQEYGHGWMAGLATALEYHGDTPVITLFAGTITAKEAHLGPTAGHTPCSESGSNSRSSGSKRTGKIKKVNMEATY